MKSPGLEAHLSEWAHVRRVVDTPPHTSLGTCTRPSSGDGAGERGAGGHTDGCVRCGASAPWAVGSIVKSRWANSDMHRGQEVESTHRLLVGAGEDEIYGASRPE